MYSPNTPDAYRVTDTAILCHVPKDRVTERSAYEFFSGFSENGAPQWSTDIAQRAAVLGFPGGVNRLDATYSAPLKRYLLTLISAARAGGISHFSILDAPEPWGPWTTVFHTLAGNSDIDWGESQHIPSKWISPDGKVFHLVFSGNDSFAVRKATLLTGGATDPPPSAPSGLRVK